MQSPRSAHSAHSGNKSIVATDAAIPERPMSERMDKSIPMKTFMVVDRIREKNKAGDEDRAFFVIPWEVLPRGQHCLCV